MSVHVVARREPGAFEALPEVETGVEDTLRRELARELHDRVAQSLTVMLLELELFRRQQYGRQSVLSAISELQSRTTLVLDELRELLFDLRPEVPGRESAVDLTRALAAGLEARLNVQVSVSVSPGWPQHLATHRAHHIQRIVNEAVHNAVRHGGARHLQVTFDRDESGRLQISIADDGTGIEDLDAVPAGLGLVGMRERALLLGGTLQVLRSDTGGTLVRLGLPDLPGGYQ